jgi:Tfp pilus assembly protein PilX
MRNSILKNQSEQGSITVIALMILVVLTLLGITITRTSTIDIQIAGNEIPYKQNFYVAEGGVHREAAEVGRGNYPVTDINNFGYELANETAHSPRHNVAGINYDFKLVYEGYFLPPQGYSVVHFSRYDYNARDVETTGGGVKITSRYFKIGPKAE